MTGLEDKNRVRNEKESTETHKLFSEIKNAGEKLNKERNVAEEIK